MRFEGRFVHRNVLDVDTCKKLVDIHEKNGWSHTFIHNIKDEDGDYTMDQVNKVMNVIHNDWSKYFEKLDIDFSQIYTSNKGGKNIHEDQTYRKWSCSTILNDDYDEGHFRFHNPEAKYKLNVGDVISFKSDNTHSVDPTDGRNRIVMTIWLKDEATESTVSKAMNSPKSVCDRFSKFYVQKRK